MGKTRPHWALILLLATWVMPFVIYVGSVRTTPYRISLLILFVPCLVWLMQGRAGRFRLPDTLIVLFAIWCVISLSAVHGPTAQIQTEGIQVLETLTPYFVARCCIRNADDFYAFAKLLTWIVFALVPFSVYETITGVNLYLELAQHILPVLDFTDKVPRLGLRRVQLFFDHPILMGVCIGSILALTHIVVGRELTFRRRWFRSVVVGLTAALSVSSGPLSGIALQIGLMSWNRVFNWLQGRWLLLASLITLSMMTVQLFAKRPLLNILVSFSFEPESGYFRLVIWEFGTMSVANHPWFGVGMGQWDRPYWMPPSIDIFWLYNAITYGLPAAILMLGFFFAVIGSVARPRNLDARHSDYRLAFLIVMAFFFLTGWMVHFWNGTYVFFMLLMGSGVWLSDAPQGDPVADTTSHRPRPQGTIRRRPAPAQHHAGREANR